jgi:mRNA interferase MazF
MFPSISSKQSFPALEVFDEWNEEKKKLHEREIFYIDEKGARKSKILFKEGEIWWTSMWQNIGSESYGKWKQFSRPVYIFRKLSAEAFLGIPMTSQKKEWSWYYQYSLGWQDGCMILSQMRYFSAKRLLSRMTDVPEPDEQEILEVVRGFLRL